MTTATYTPQQFTPTNKPTRLPNWLRWIDSDYFPQGADVARATAPGLSWTRLIPFAFLHGCCLGAFWTGVSPVALGVCIAAYWVRMFAVTAFFHRYFSHRTFETSRFMQFIFAIWSMTSAQRGTLWWAANHRHHHHHSDEEVDLHSPKQRGFFWAQMGWLMAERSMPTDYSKIPDLVKFPELVWLNRFDWVVPMLAILFMYSLGEGLNALWPGLHTNGLQMLVWGFFISTVILFYGTNSINSLSHMWGSQRYETGDTSRNNFFLSIITLGEGWHNNHHRYQGAVRQGFYWWEMDITFYVLKVMSWLGLVWNLHPVPPQAYDPAYQLPKAGKQKISDQALSTPEARPQQPASSKPAVA